jgi:hypothetical protein
MNPGEGGRGGIDWFDLAQDRDWWKAFVNMVMNGFREVLRSSLVTAIQVAPQEGPSSIKVVIVKTHCSVMDPFSRIIGFLDRSY